MAGARSNPCRLPLTSVAQAALLLSGICWQVTSYALGTAPTLDGLRSHRALKRARTLFCQTLHVAFCCLVSVVSHAANVSVVSHAANRCRCVREPRGATASLTSRRLFETLGETTHVCRHTTNISRCKQDDSLEPRTQRPYTTVSLVQANKSGVMTTGLEMMITTLLLTHGLRATDEDETTWYDANW